MAITTSPYRHSPDEGHYAAVIVKPSQHIYSPTMPFGESYFNPSQCFPRTLDKPNQLLTCRIQSLGQSPATNLALRLKTLTLEGQDTTTMFMFQKLPPGELKSLVDAKTSNCLRQTSILQHWLRLQTIPFARHVAIDSLRDAIIVGLDAEWYEHDSNYITELGVSILDPRFIKNRSSAWEVLKTMVNHHVRIKPNAHMINSELCYGYSEDFQFGKTTFVEIEEAKNMLRHSFLRYDARGQQRPVIFVGHAVDNDAKMIKERFGLDIDALGVVVATVDTQILARETGLAVGERKIRLSDLLGKFGITEKYLHNAGNDIVCTMISALLVQSPNILDGHHTAYKDLKMHLQKTSKSLYGTSVFCTKCDSSSHVAADCHGIVHCDQCANYTSRCGNAHSHSTGKCLEVFKDAAKQAMGIPPRRRSAPPNACPCQYCIESLDPKRYIMSYAYGHKKEECVYGPGRAPVSPASV